MDSGYSKAQIKEGKKQEGMELLAKRREEMQKMHEPTLTKIIKAHSPIFYTVHPQKDGDKVSLSHHSPTHSFTVAVYTTLALTITLTHHTTYKLLGYKYTKMAPDYIRDNCHALSR